MNEGTTRQELEAKLEQLVESDGEASAISALMAQLDARPDEVEAKEESMDFTPESMGLEPTVVAPVEPQPALPIEKEQNMSKQFTITKESLGATEFKSVLSTLSMSQIKSYLFDGPEGWDDLKVLASPGVTINDADHREHLVEAGEVSRAARGFALFAAGGVTDGIITSPDGSIHYVEEGVCYEKTSSKQPDSFSSGFATIEKISACKGHLKYKNVGTSDEPKFERADGEYTRCMHQWALMFNAGYYVTFSKEKHMDRAICEIAKRVGDETAREVAKQQFAEWSENRQTRFETRKAFAQASSHARNTMGLPEGAMLPDVPEVLGYKLPDGRTMQEAILDLKGSAFVVEFTVPVNGEAVVQRVKAMSINEVRSRMAPAYALAKTQGGQIGLVSVLPAA